MKKVNLPRKSLPSERKEKKGKGRKKLVDCRSAGMTSALGAWNWGTGSMATQNNAMVQGEGGNRRLPIQEKPDTRSSLRSDRKNLRRRGAGIRREKCPKPGKRKKTIRMRKEGVSSSITDQTRGRTKTGTKAKGRVGSIKDGGRLVQKKKNSTKNRRRGQETSSNIASTVRFTRGHKGGSPDGGEIIKGVSQSARTYAPDRRFGGKKV